MVAVRPAQWPTTSTCARSIRSTRIQFDDGSYFDYSGDLDAMRAEVRRFNPADLAGFDGFMAESENCYRLGFEELATVAFDSVGDLMAALALDDEDAGMAHAVLDDSAPPERSEAAHRLQLFTLC